MRPFNLEEAKAGKPVVTRDGRDAVILAFDISGSYPMLGYYISSGCKKEATWDYDGNFYQGNDSRDLFMKSETNLRFINLFRNGHDNKLFSVEIHTTLQDAEKEAKGIIYATADKFIVTIPITWEE
jgi:hypothetical protein